MQVNFSSIFIIDHYINNCHLTHCYYMCRFTKEKKTDIKQKVEQMGGIYSTAFHDGVTHLVAEVSDA